MNPDNVKIFVALITGLLGLITAVFSTLKANKHAKKMVHLQEEQTKKLAAFQAELDVKKESDNIRMKFLLSYETDKVNQYMISLKDFLTTSQKLKDEVRGIVEHFDVLIPAERFEQISGLRNKIVKQYANNVYYFNKADKDKIAHEIKNLFVDVFGLLENNAEGMKLSVAEIVNIISQKQLLLHEAIEIEIDQMIAKM